MYSRIRARVPSARQGGEQYTCGLPCLVPAENALPQTRHSDAISRARRGGGGGAAADAAAGEPGEGAAEDLRRRAYPFLRHGSEQYRTDRLRVPNALPHSPHRRRCTLAASLSALFPHRAQ